MQTKTFRAENMLAAMEQVRNELGSEALIVSIRKVLTGPAWQVWQKPQVEVVAVSQQTNAEKSALPKGAQKPSAQQGSQKKHAQPVQKQPVKEAIPAEDIHREPGKTQDSSKEIVLDALFSSEKMQKTVTADSQETAQQDKSEFLGKLILQLARQQESSKPSEPELPPVEIATKPSIPQKQDDQKLQMILLHLQDYQLENELLDQVRSSCKEILFGKTLSDEQKILDCIQTQLISKVRTVEHSGQSGVPIFLVGASGAGKTTTCAKLAIHFSTMQNKKVFWVCADTIRFGAVQEAKNYCDTIGIPMQPVYSSEELRQLVDAVREEFDIVLIDMPAYNALDENNLIDLGGMITSIPARLIWLVVPATSAYQAMLNQVNAIKPFRPSGMIYTKLDEITQFGSMVNLAWRSQLPLVFLAFGSQLINEMIPAKAELLVRALFSERFKI